MMAAPRKKHEGASGGVTTDTSEQAFISFTCYHDLFSSVPNRCFFAIQSAKYMLAICYRYLLGLVGKKVQETLLKIPVLVTTKTAGDVVMSPLKHLFFL